MTASARPDLYISADVETDGAVPGPYSMLSFGLVVVGTYDGQHLTRREISEATTFYRELKPISDRFDPDALAVNGLNRDHLAAVADTPASAMTQAAEWVAEVSAGCRPVLVAYPVAFDWSFLYWYFEQFSEAGSPFGHSSCLDIRTLYQTMTGNVFDASGKSAMPESVRPDAPHTHNALDDAIEQGELFATLFMLAQAQRAGDLQLRSTNELTRDVTPSWVRSQMVPARTRNVVFD